MTLRDFLDLVHIRRAPTALSDVAAAAVLGSATTEGEVSVLRASAAAATGVLLYLGGIALNDLADAEDDASERPWRPIPSGRVGRAEAVAVVLMLLGAGVGVSWLAGQVAFAVALVLLLAVVAYDTSLAGRPLVGPTGMALCRALNWALGLAAVGSLEGIALVGVGIVFVYAFGLDHLGLGVEGGSARSGVAIAWLTTLAAALAVLLLARRLHDPLPAQHLVAVVLPLLLLGARAAPPLARALHRPTAGSVQASVEALGGGITLIGASVAAAASSWWALLPFAALVAGQEMLARRFRTS